MVFFQAEDGIRGLVRSRGLGDVYKRQDKVVHCVGGLLGVQLDEDIAGIGVDHGRVALLQVCLLYTSDAADERSSVDLGGRRIIKQKKQRQHSVQHTLS